VSPRPTLPGLLALGGFRRPQRADVWSVVCFYIAEPRRGTGLAKGLLRAAVEYAVAQGAAIIEGYPFVPEAFGDGAGGSTTLFAQAGFVEVARVSDVQRVMRYFVDRQAQARAAGLGDP
jgi:L-amino acid N-acyltransferase YncA